MAGPSSTVDALSLPFREAIEFLRQKVPTATDGWTDVWQKANAKAFAVAGAKTKALLGDFRREVLRALEAGSTLQEFRAAFDDIVRKHGWQHTGKAAWRSRIIYETNLSMAYAAGRYAQMTEPETLAAFPYWQYVHSGARHPRKQHLDWNGTVLAADDPFWDWAYPPNGWGCGCRVRPLTRAGLRRQGKSGPDRAPERVPTEMVHRRTGEVLRGSRGVDFGFDYNPGQAWRDRPAGDVPGLRAATSAPAAAPAPAADAAQVRNFAARVLAGAVVDPGTSVLAARLPPALAQRMGGGLTDIELSAFRVLKVAGRAQEAGGRPSTPHPEITPDDWADLQHLIDTGEAFLETPADAGRRQLYIFGANRAGRDRMLVIRRVARPDGGERLIVPNYEESGRRRRARVLRRLSRQQEE